LSKPVISFLESIETDFKLHQNIITNVSSIYSGLTDDNTQFLKLRDSWNAGRWLELPISRLTDKVLNHYEIGEFDTEIKYNSVNNHMGYFEYAKAVFFKCFRYLNSQFPKEIDEYFDDVEEAQALVEDLTHRPATLSDAEFYKAILFEFIQVFKWLEEQFYWLYPFYDPQLLKYDKFEQVSLSYERFSKISSSHREYMILDYGDKNDEVIKMMHDALNKIYIEDISLDKFSKYFTSEPPPEKLRWRKSAVGLLILFKGKEIPLKFDEEPKLLRIKTNGSAVKMICDNFLDEDGQTFDPKRVENNKKNLKSEVNRGTEELIQLLKDVHNLK